MTIKEIIQKLHTTMIDARGQESHFESWMALNEGICDAIDALKALDKQEPIGYVNEAKPDRLIAQKQETIEGLNRDYDLLFAEHQLLLKKEWVGLTQDELNMIGDSMRTWNSWTITDVYFAIEAKLKQKNTKGQE